MSEDHVYDVKEEADQVIAPWVKAEKLVGETLDQPAKRLVDTTFERREREPDLFPAQPPERVVLQNPVLVVPIHEPIAEDRRECDPDTRDKHGPDRPDFSQARYFRRFKGSVAALLRRFFLPTARRSGG